MMALWLWSMLMVIVFLVFTLLRKDK